MSTDTPTDSTPPEKAAPRSAQDKRQSREIANTGQSIRAVTADAQADPAMAQELEEGGFPLTELQRADTLQEEAQAALADHLAVAGLKDDANKAYAVAEKSLTTLYLGQRGLARSAYLKDRDALEKLGISGAAPRSLADIMNATEILVRNAPLPLYADKLTRRGVTAAKLQTLNTRLAALQAADLAQNSAIQAVPPATARRNAAAQALADWFVEFKAYAKVQFKDRPEILKRWGIK